MLSAGASPRMLPPSPADDLIPPAKPRRQLSSPASSGGSGGGGGGGGSGGVSGSGGGSNSSPRQPGTSANSLVREVLQDSGLTGLVDPRSVSRELAEVTSMTIDEMNQAANELVRRRSLSGQHLANPWTQKPPLSPQMDNSSR